MPKIEDFCEKSKKLHIIEKVHCARNASGYLNSGNPLYYTELLFYCIEHRVRYYLLYAILWLDTGILA